MEQEKIDISSKLYNTPFVEQVAFNLEQLEYRYNELVEIDTSDKENQRLYLMIFDSFIVLFRAMFLETGDKQYTLQNYFKLRGQNNVADKIDTYLDSYFYDWDTISIKKVLKFIADKFVCHVDPISRIDLGMANAYMAVLNNPYEKNNIRNIMKQLFDIIREGLDTK
jgi:hypothetical protein